MSSSNRLVCCSAARERSRIISYLRDSTLAPRLVILTGLLAGLVACATITPVGTERRTIAGGYSVAPQVKWSRFPTGEFETWTIDGVFLEFVRFSRAVADGEPLFAGSGPNRDKFPIFHARMSANEVMELVVDSLTAEGWGNVSPESLEPFRFGSALGFRFELGLVARGGLEYDGLAAGVIKGDQLYLILYVGAREHYFAKHRGTVERLLASIGDPV